MAWYNNFGYWVSEKLNPAQPYYTEKTVGSNEPTFTYQQAYETLEVVNRGTNIIVDDVSEIDFMVGDSLGIDPKQKGVRKVQVDRVLNKQPNPYQDLSSFRRNCIIDYIIDGNIFIFWDAPASAMYHLPASSMKIHASEKTYVDHYTYNEDVKFKPNEIIHIKENSFRSIYRGTSRLHPALKTMVLTNNMKSFQSNFFKNGAVPGLVIKHPSSLGPRLKQKLISSWQQSYNPDGGGRRPMILDSGMDLESVNSTNFKELDFQTAIADNEKIILKALGVPPIMLDSGNNANLKPNMRMYYLETIMPILEKMASAYEAFFGYELTADTSEITSLRPEISEQAAYYTSLVNTGLITPNEARDALGFEQMPNADDLRIPANIAGSAGNPLEGGRPTETEEN